MCCISHLSFTPHPYPSHNTPNDQEHDGQELSNNKQPMANRICRNPCYTSFPLPNSCNMLKYNVLHVFSTTSDPHHSHIVVVYKSQSKSHPQDLPCAHRNNNVVRIDITIKVSSPYLSNYHVSVLPDSDTKSAIKRIICCCCGSVTSSTLPHGCTLRVCSFRPLDKTMFPGTSTTTIPSIEI